MNYQQLHNHVEKNLNGFYNPVYLDCDGYLVSIRMAKESAFKLVAEIHIDGWFRGKWMTKAGHQDEPEEAVRFFRLAKSYLYKPSEIKRIQKELGKRLAAKYFDFDKHYLYRDAFWKSTRSMCRHFIKHNKVIEIIDYDEYAKRLAAKSSVEKP